MRTCSQFIFLSLAVCKCTLAISGTLLALLTHTSCELRVYCSSQGDCEGFPANYFYFPSIYHGCCCCFSSASAAGDCFVVCLLNYWLQYLRSFCLRRTRLQIKARKTCRLVYLKYKITFVTNRPTNRAKFEENWAKFEANQVKL